MKLKPITVIHVTEEEEKALDTIYEAVYGLCFERCKDDVVSEAIQDLCHALSNFSKYVTVDA